MITFARHKTRALLLAANVVMNSYAIGTFRNIFPHFYTIIGFCVRYYKKTRIC